jgi:drug/metabolite transporter (DMT)-like permease
VVAVFLGWLFFREPFGWREAFAMLIIFAGIAIVKWSESRTATAAQLQPSAGEMETVGPEP